MLALGIDTSTRAGSIGLADDSGILAELSLSSGRPHSEGLLDAVRSVLAGAGARVDRIDVFAVASGPGSFTGLRIGMATAQGLALAAARPVTGFSTLEMIALCCPVPSMPGVPAGDSGAAVCVLTDAGRGEVYRGLFRRVGDEMTQLAPERLMRPQEAAAALPDRCLVTGDAVAVYRELLRPHLTGGRAVVEPPPAIGGGLAVRAVRLGSASRLPPLRPNYLRPSDAEVTFKG